METLYCIKDMYGQTLYPCVNFVDGSNLIDILCNINLNTSFEMFRLSDNFRKISKFHSEVK